MPANLARRLLTVLAALIILSGTAAATVQATTAHASHAIVSATGGGNPDTPWD